VRRDSTTTFLNYVVLGLIVIYSVLPILWIFLAAFDARADLFVKWPDFTFANFRRFFTETDGVRWLINSLIYSIGSVLIVTVVAALGGYTLSRLRFWWKRPFLYGIILIRIIPSTALIVPLFKILQSVHLLDTYLGLTLVLAAFQTPLALWIMKTFFDTIPVELEEAAWVDGASRFRSLFAIVFPLSFPGVAAAGLFTFLGAWGEFLKPLVLISSQDKLPLSIGLFKAFVAYTNVDYGFMTALAIVYSVPAVVFFMLARTFLVKSFAIGGVKG
jgi:multiple sugar transport system permease protein